MLQAAFYTTQPFPSLHPTLSAAWQRASTGKVVLVGRRRHSDGNGMRNEQKEMEAGWQCGFFQTAKSGRLWNPHYLNHLNINWIKALQKILQSVD